MQLSYFIQRLKNFSLQNMATDFFDNVDRVYHINTSLIYMYNYMNSNGNRYRSNVDENLAATIDPVNGDTAWTTTYKLSRIRKMRDTTTSTAPAEMALSNVSFYMDENIYNDYSGTLSTTSTWYRITWSNTFLSSRALMNIKMVYARLPIRHDYNDLTVALDIPDDMAGILEFFVFRRLMPIHLEQGASLANNYFSQANSSLEMYAKNIWLLSPQTNFTV